MQRSSEKSKRSFRSLGCITSYDRIQGTNLVELGSERYVSVPLDCRADGQSNRIYVPNSHPILADERIKRRLGDQVFTSGKSYQAMPGTNADCQKVQRWSMYSTTFCLRSRRMWPLSYRPSCPCPLHQRTALRQLRHRCLLPHNSICFGKHRTGLEYWVR